MTVRSLLSILSDGKFHSGQELGEHLGISRSAIWKHMRRLEEDGLEIYSVKGRGYRIPGGLDLLNTGQLDQLLAPALRQQLGQVDLQLNTASTNAAAMSDCLRGNCHGNLYLAEQQSAGRGRRGRTWVSPFGRNLYFSLVWRFDQGIGALEGLSLVVGLALVQALERMGLSGAQLKWPNDLLVNGRKLAGILLEINGETSGACQVVIGVGINVAMPYVQGEQIDQPWTDLATEMRGEGLLRNQVLASCLNELIPLLVQFSERGFVEFAEHWQNYNAHQGQPIILKVGEEEVAGVCQGVDASGALLLETGQGVQTYHGGEISIQRSL
ncbi:bifunctional biotin--[acetyl-CoA-carboxylase] ligase/biotin operon repressor BirA [Pontibacter sp. JAM-7]|uniref:bifunctional biotin--[acetyl-CoA-carboxylase] ligase/biotin operon repressor BirA n=1 Tax=Pontibacter sp. JAM-7 TaxID=3366581 RepID=UPI003AF570BB